MESFFESSNQVSNLKNGLTFLSSEVKNYPLQFLALYFNSGTRYENSNELGYAHFLEHMLLKGTKNNPSAYLLSSQIEKIGGYKNGLTSKEFNWYVVEIGASDSEKGFSFLSEIILDSLFDEKTLENEKGIILEEYAKRREINPDFLLRSSISEMFKNHPLGADSIFSEENTKSANREKLINYFNKFYFPKNAALFSFGGSDHKNNKQYAEKYFSGWNSVHNPERVNNQTEFSKIKEKYGFLEKATNTDYICLNYYTSGMKDDLNERQILNMLGYYLSAGSSCLLMDELRNKKGLIYFVSAFPSSYSDGGVFSIQTSSKKSEETVKNLYDILNNLTARITEEEFEKLKHQSINLFLLKNKNEEDNFQFIAENFIYKNDISTIDDYLLNMKQIKFKDFVEVVNKYIKYGNSYLMTLGPKKLSL